MTTFTFLMVDEVCGIKVEQRYVVDDKEGERILDCYSKGWGCKGHEEAFRAMTKQMMQMVTNHVCAYERANAAQPIVPKPE